MFAAQPAIVRSPPTFLIGMLLAVLLAVGCAPTATPTVPRDEEALDASVDADVEHLLGLMRERLLVMHEVARWKWHHRQPITDAAREKLLLKQTAETAHELGLDAELAVRFMTAQIGAGKQVQQQDMDGWQTRPPPQDKTVPDLATELRPKVDQLNADLLKTLARVAGHLNDEPVQRRLSVAADVALAGTGLSDEVRTTALEPLTTSRN